MKGQCPRPLDEGDNLLLLGNKRIYNTSYNIKLGAGNETRTRDPDLGKVVLYQLSYSRSGIPKGSRTPVTAVKGQCPRPLDDGDPETFCLNVCDVVCRSGAHSKEQPLVCQHFYS